MFKRVPSKIMYNKVTDIKSQTVPARALSVREIIDKYRYSGVVVDTTNPVYGNDIVHRPELDLVDRYQIARNLVFTQEKARLEAVEKRNAAAKAALQKQIDDEVNRRLKESSKDS